MSTERTLDIFFNSTPPEKQRLQMVLKDVKGWTYFMLSTEQRKQSGAFIWGIKLPIPLAGSRDWHLRRVSMRVARLAVTPGELRVWFKDSAAAQ